VSVCVCVCVCVAGVGGCSRIETLTFFSHFLFIGLFVLLSKRLLQSHLLSFQLSF
jgi:hypothetical protein